MEFKELYYTMMKPFADGMSKSWAAGKNRLIATFLYLTCPQSEHLRGRTRGNSGPVDPTFYFAVIVRVRVTYREPILDMQLVQDRIANASMDLFAAILFLSRIDVRFNSQAERQRSIAGASRGRFFFCANRSSIRGFLAGLTLMTTSSGSRRQNLA